MTTATLSIIKVSDGLPDADTDVIVFLQDGASTIGAINETGWIDPAAGMPFAQLGDKVVAWAEFPTLDVETLA